LRAAQGQGTATCDLAAIDAVRSRCASAWMDPQSALDDILVIGTHNSYKQRLPCR